LPPSHNGQSVGLPQSRKVLNDMQHFAADQRAADRPREERETIGALRWQRLGGGCPPVESGAERIGAGLEQEVRQRSGK
jgi:hypothetical protein